MEFSKHGQITNRTASNFSQSAVQFENPATLCCSQIYLDLESGTADVSLSPLPTTAEEDWK